MGHLIQGIALQIIFTDIGKIQAIATLGDGKGKLTHLLTTIFPFTTTRQQSSTILCNKTVFT